MKYDYQLSDNEKNSYYELVYKDYKKVLRRMIIQASNWEEAYKQLIKYEGPYIEFISWNRLTESEYKTYY